VRGRFISFPLTLIAAVPAMVLGYLILQNWVNVPLFDEWDTPGRLLNEVLVQGRFSWHTLFAQHNESRMVLPKLLWLGSAALFGWDTKIGQAVTWMAALATWACWAALMHRAVDYSALRRFVLLSLMSLIFFCTNQWENWLWAFQLTTFLPGLCLSGCLVLHQSSLGYPRKVLLCALLSLISTYSNANGMLCWVLGWPLPLRDYGIVTDKAGHSRGSIIGWTLAYLVVMCSSIAAYFHGYRTPGNHPPPGYAFAHLGETLHYLVAWIGNPFARGIGFTPLKVATVAGSIGLTVFVLIVAVGWWQRSNLQNQAFSREFYPWLVVTLYGLGSGFITAVGRVGLGIEQAIATRYITFACYVFVGLIGMAGYVLTRGASRNSGSSPILRIAEAVLAGVFIVFMVADWKQSLPAFQSHRRAEEQLRLTLRFVPLIQDDPLLSGLYPDRTTVRQLALPLLTHHVLRQQPVGSWLPTKLPAPDGEDGGAFTVIKEGSVTRLHGHSIIPNGRRWPDCIVVTATENNIERLVTAIVLPQPKDVGGTGPNRDFAADFPAGALPEIENIRAYSADLSHRQLFTLAPAARLGYSPSRTLRTSPSRNATAW
jgi:hypothetical protein